MPAKLKASSENSNVINGFEAKLWRAADKLRPAPEKSRKLIGVLDEMSEANAARRVNRLAKHTNQFCITVTMKKRLPNHRSALTTETA